MYTTGKTFLARALAYRACQAAHRVVVTSATRMLNELAGAELHGHLERTVRRYCRADLLVIDDFAVLVMDPTQAKLAFQVISDRYDYRRSTCITTNRLFKDWPKVLAACPGYGALRNAPVAVCAASSPKGCRNSGARRRLGGCRLRDQRFRVPGPAPASRALAISALTQPAIVRWSRAAARSIWAYVSGLTRREIRLSSSAGGMSARAIVGSQPETVNKCTHLSPRIFFGDTWGSLKDKGVTWSPR